MHTTVFCSFSISTTGFQWIDGERGEESRSAVAAAAAAIKVGKAFAMTQQYQRRGRRSQSEVGYRMGGCRMYRLAIREQELRWPPRARREQ
ncbi:hypothetical protein B296_00015897 [Ensete ventricosum]|uniref:Uncharacterized protein n=1 Tax=Ensete ventricosum TaxID=4639 RepID=A0A426YRM7_ENSVE|nr:hypothetical protein B296_00015897 [Ensete ventricosum]